MKLYDNGCYFSVSVSCREVENFASRWPCFGSTRTMWFQFDKQNGDLVDIVGDKGMDSAGVLALSIDCQTWGVKELHTRERTTL